jgi:hypothetical protein
MNCSLCKFDIANYKCFLCQKEYCGDCFDIDKCAKCNNIICESCVDRLRLYDDGKSYCDICAANLCFNCNNEIKNNEKCSYCGIRICKECEDTYFMKTCYTCNRTRCYDTNGYHVIVCLAAQILKGDYYCRNCEIALQKGE